jgi:ferrous iron transport protein A
MASLDHLRPGQCARIRAIQGAPSLVQRLLEMGLLEGEPVEVVGFAPLGDPMEIRLRDYCLSLRRNEAACITVELPSTDCGVTETRAP